MHIRQNCQSKRQDLNSLSAANWFTKKKKKKNSIKWNQVAPFLTPDVQWAVTKHKTTKQCLVDQTWNEKAGKEKCRAGKNSQMACLQYAALTCVH